jgi:pimeloyl-ACP methyl ester carboxylesterase
MRFGKLARLFTGIASITGIFAYARYRKEMDALRADLDTESTIAETDFGDIEYAEQGQGKPALVIHGAGGGYDQGLIIGRDLGEGFRVIAPSRFGYLKTPVPAEPLPAAQADAHAALLDFLGVQRAVVVGASAGAPSAIELALRHPERVSALILLVPRTYDPVQAVGADQSAPSQAVLRLIERGADFPFWLATRLQRSAVVRFLGVRPCLEAAASPEERARVDEIIESIQPLSERVRGIEIDSATDIDPWPLQRIQLPTLIISAKDDLFRTLPGAQFTADHIPEAELHVLEEGGHLMVGQTAQVRSWIGDFLRRNAEPKPKPRRTRERHVAKVLEPVA